MLEIINYLRRLEELLIRTDDDNDAAARSALLEDIRATQRLCLQLTPTERGAVHVARSHDAYAVEVVTAYLDGAERGDGYSILGEVVSRGACESDNNPAWLPSVIAALARLGGDLAIIAASRTGGTTWEDARHVIQGLARDAED